MQTWILNTYADTKNVADSFARYANPGDIYLLSGDLGAGKTTFCQFFIQEFLKNPDISVTSPTFPIIQTYGQNNQIWHIDLYRIEDEREIYHLGLEEAASSIMLIEWPERLGSFKLRGKIFILEFTLNDGVRSLYLRE